MGCVYFSLKTFKDEIKSLSRNKLIALVYEFIATPSYIEQIRSRRLLCVGATNHVGEILGDVSWLELQERRQRAPFFL